MIKYFFIILLLAFFVKPDINAQQQGFLVKTASFSSKINDEFSPVFYKEGIVFCSNERDNSLISYTDDQNRLFKIFYVTQRGKTGWNHPKLLAKELSTGFNDGPVTFNEKGNIIYYSRNNSITGYIRNISDTTNKLGIFSAELINGIWTNIKPFPYNDPLYTLCTPTLNPDGERIYFSSDMTGGKGGMDLYYCDFKNNDWDKPVNLGPVINTSKNESFPFACKSGKLFFSSDGHPGFGGKDLYYTMEINGDWMLPVHLDSTINSTADDFGLVTDSTFDNGYFSTNRKKTDDIFSFTSAPVEFTNCDSIKENTYCFTFFDELHKLIDTIPVIYKWDFGEGIIRTGTEVKHCFPGPGDYLVKLTITDELTRDTIADQVEYKVNLEKIEQAGFNSKNIGVVDQVISFEGLESNLKGFQIADFLWNFGDGFKSGKPLINKKFEKEGEYIIELGLLSAADSLGKVSKVCALKKVKIFNNYSELNLNGENSRNDNDSAGKKGNTVQSRFYFMDDLTERYKLKIKESLKNSVESLIRFDKYGIVPASYNFLDNIVVLLKENPELRLELELYTYNEEVPSDKIGLSEILAQELAFYFKNKGLDRNTYRCNGFGLYEPALSESSAGDKSFDGMAEFKFMKN